MAFRLGMADSRPIKNSFSFYRADMAVLEALVTGLKEAGVKVREATVLRALIHLATPTEMITHAVRFAGDRALGITPPEEENVAGRPTVDLPDVDVKKLDDVLDHLAKAKLVATRAYVVRALLRAAPDGKTLAPAVEKFLVDFPNRPRGLAVRMAREANNHG